MKKRTIKKYHLKNSIKTIILLFGLLIACGLVLNFIEESNYKKAVDKCGDHNIMTQYTKDGDKFYKCINEK